MSKRRSLLATGPCTVLFVLASSVPAAAQATYIYTGQNFTEAFNGLTTTDHLSATMQLTNPLPPNQVCIDPTTLPGFSLSMTDGVNGTATFGDPAPGFGSPFVRVSTDSSGAITTPWRIILFYIDPLQRVRLLDSSHTPVACAGVSGSAIDQSDTIGGTFGPRGITTARGAWSNPSATILLTMLTTQFDLGILPDVGKSFREQLRQIANDIATNNGQACQDLRAFANHVRAQTGKKLSSAQAEAILRTAGLIAAELTCVI